VDVTAFITRLYAAFAEAPRPSKDEITPHRCPECDDVAARLAPHNHADVPDADLYFLGDSLPLLSPKAFRYYLPSYVAFCMTHRDSSLDGLINYSLAPSSALDEGDRNRFVYFSPEERSVIAEFVEHRAGLEEAELDRADLDRATQYWGATPNNKLQRSRGSASESNDG
jgi:hypothetical protein